MKLHAFVAFAVVDGNWGQWSAWNTCSKTCEQGTQSRTRKCDSPVPRYGGKLCEGKSNQAQVCNKNIPCPGYINCLFVCLFFCLCINC